MSNDKHLQVSVWRGDKDKGHFAQFDVPAYESQTVLDVVSWIQHYEDPTLTYRFSCRVGMCGSCAMMVNGEPRWTCRTHVKKVSSNDKLEIAPLRNLPVVKDLVTDMAPFFEKWVKAEAFHHPSKTRHDEFDAIKPDDTARQKANEAIECINCAVCYAACDTVTHQPDYLGPAALQRAYTLIHDERDADTGAILEAISQTDGCHNCHSMGSCSHYCPNELNPMMAIADLKKRSLLHRLLGAKDK